MALPIIMQQVNAINAFRKSLIGMMLPTTMASLPGGFIEPDGSLILFEDYPEFAEAYQSGKFNNMVLPADASNTDKSNWAGKYVLNAQGTGLYAPRLNGLFLRNSANSGRYNAPGIPNATGNFWDLTAALPNDTGAMGSANGVFRTNALQNNAIRNLSSGLVTGGTGDGISIDLSRANAIFGSSSTVMPESSDSKYAIYLGNIA